MPRPRRWRHVYNKVNFDYFKPRGVPMNDLKEIQLNVEELEALRYSDYQEMEQTQAADIMRVSQPTFHRILKEARKKVADALVNGSAIRIQGGNYQMAPGGGGRWRFANQEALKHAKFEVKSQMKIVISSKGEYIDSEIDPRFGRCRYFLVVETDNKEIKNIYAMKNEGSGQAQGAGISAAQQVASLKPDTIITGQMGPNAKGVLVQAGLPVFTAAGHINEAVQALLGNKLDKI